MHGAVRREPTRTYVYRADVVHHFPPNRAPIHSFGTVTGRDIQKWHLDPEGVKQVGFCVTKHTEVLYMTCSR